MGKGHYHGGSTEGFYDEAGNVTFKQGPEAPLVKRAPKKRWSETTVADGDARAAASKYRRLVSVFLASCATAFRNETLGASTPAPPMELRAEIAAWGGNVDWIDKHERRRRQFAKFVTDQGWKAP